jgi:hypothetical protein
MTRLRKLRLEDFMQRFLAPLLASAALCLALPAHAELDVPALKSAIEASVEKTTTISMRSTRISTPIPRSPSRR